MTTVRTFTSSVLDPADRGRELGAAFAGDVARTVTAYRTLFAARATRPFDVDLWAERAWATIGEVDPAAAEEIAGIAEGARLPVHEIAMLNARTELLAVADPTGAGSGECSTVVALPDGGGPVAVQTWDWYDVMADDWLVWSIPHPDGHVVRTVTELGVLGKIGVSSRGVGVMFNLLRHDADALAEDTGIGHPVHLLARRILDTAGDVEEALAMARSVTPSASTSITVVDETGAAASVELFPGGPGGPGVVRPEDGLLVRTNHFVSSEGADGCLAASLSQDSHIRRRTLLDAFADRPPQTADDVVRAMDDHRDVGGVCCHPAADADPVLAHATLATVAIDVTDRSLGVMRGGPCARRPSAAR